MSLSRVLVADSRDIFRSAVRSRLDREGGFDLMESSDLDGVLDAAAKNPALALIDLELPPEGGITAVEELHRRCSCQIVVWSFDPAAETILRAIRAGASGYLEKTVAPEALVRAIRAALGGQSALPRRLVTQMIHAMHVAEDVARARALAATLSIREREVLGLVGAGATNTEIAAKLAISEFTVKRHLQNILAKLELPSRRAAASLWRLAVPAERSTE